MGLKVIIPTAGKGTRLLPFTNSTPKVLLHVAGKPVLGHLFESLLQCSKQNAKFKIEELIIVHGHLGERVIQYVESTIGNRKSEIGIRRISFVHQKEEIGLGHAIFLCKHLFKNEPVLILLGDTIFEVDYSRVVRETCVGVKTIEDPRRFGIVEIQNDFVTKIVEKPKEKKRSPVLIGLYYFEHSKPLFDVLDELVEYHQSKIGNLKSQIKEWWEGEIQFTDALQMLADRGENIRPFEVEGWYDCGTPEAFLSTNHNLLEIGNRKSEIGNYSTLRTPNSAFPNTEIIPPVSIHPDAKIEDSKIGPYVSVAKGATIRNAVLLDVIVNEGATIVGARSRHGGMPLHLKGKIVGENETITADNRP